MSLAQKKIEESKLLILPGVGSFSKGMRELKSRGIDQAIMAALQNNNAKILGICLGMQLMASFSEEGNSTGLGWVDASVKKFKTSDSQKFKIPHMGWNTINSTKKSALMNNIASNEEFYFVHSFYMQPNDSDLILNETNYIEKFCSGIEQENIFGVQYHPEKSHDSGRTLLKNFISL